MNWPSPPLSSATGLDIYLAKLEESHNFFLPILGSITKSTWSIYLLVYQKYCEHLLIRVKFALNGQNIIWINKCESFLRVLCPSPWPKSLFLMDSNIGGFGLLFLYIMSDFSEFCGLYIYIHIYITFILTFPMKKNQNGR